MKQNRDILSEDEVFVGATYFVYHLKMFLESILWMQENYSGSKYQIKITNDKALPRNQYQISGSTTWDFFNNAILDINLVHARVLIDFFCNDKPQKADIVACDYFEKEKSLFPVDDEYLKGQAKKIGGRLVHLTRRAIPEMKSYQNWEIRQLAEKIIRLVHLFLDENNQSTFPEDNRKMCIVLLQKFNIGNIPDTVNAST